MHGTGAWVHGSVREVTSITLIWNATQVFDLRGSVRNTQMQTQYKGSVYLSGPIAGQTYDDARFGWRKEFAEKMAIGIKVLSPMRHEGHLAEVQAS